MEEEAISHGKKKLGFWKWAITSIAFRLLLSYFSQNLNLSARPEVSTPLTSLRRLSEGYWLKQLSISPYSGSMYHGSPLLLSILGPLTAKKIEGLPDHLLVSPFLAISFLSYQHIFGNSLVSVAADFMCAVLIRATGRRLEMVQGFSLKSLRLGKLFNDVRPSDDIAALVYLWNPFTIIACIGFNTSPIENLFVVISLYGASTGLVPLAAFGWVVASHLSLYPLVLVIPVILLLGYGVDAPPRKLFPKDYMQVGHETSADKVEHPTLTNKQAGIFSFSWKRVILFTLWASIWICYVLILCALSMKEHGGLGEMFKRTYGFILSVEDLSPNIGVLWYFFAEVFEFFRSFFLIVFHVNIIFMILPLAIRLKHRPCFLAAVYVGISAMLKSYPSVADSALYLSLLALFLNELAEMQFSFFLFCGYVGISLLSPIMHNLWIWRGTGNANFYFATAMAYACFQVILVVESVSSMQNYDRRVRKLCKTTEA